MPTEHTINLDYGLGSDIDMLRDSVRGFASEKIAPRAAEIDRKGRVPDRSMAGHGRTGSSSASRSPTTYGGADMGYLAHCVAMEEISRASASVGLSYGAHSNLCVNQIHRWGTV